MLNMHFVPCHFNFLRTPIPVGYENFNSGHPTYCTEDCTSKGEMSQRLANLEKNVESLSNSMRSLLNLMADFEMTNINFPEANEEPQVVNGTIDTRKRKPEPPKGDPKKAQLILELEEKLAADRKENSQLETQIVDLRKDIERLKAKRLRLEKEKEEREQGQVDQLPK